MKLAWIKEIDNSEAKGDLKKIYDQILEERGKIANILKVHSLNAQALKNHLSLYLDAMFQATSLDREQCELIAVIVSNENDCEYCIAHHSKALNYYWKEKERIEALREEYKAVNLSQEELRMVEYAIKLTDDPKSIEKSDIKGLRQVGLTDRQIHDLTLVVSYFNFVNRIALGLGVEATPKEVKGYEY